jgi:putative endonuclease
MPEDSFHYVYILQSKAVPDRFYIGLTRNVRERLNRHTSGNVAHTARWAPWRIKACIAFSEESKAVEFERYLKTSSGRAFAKKRL